MNEKRELKIFYNFRSHNTPFILDDYRFSFLPWKDLNENSWIYLWKREFKILTTTKYMWIHFHIQKIAKFTQNLLTCLNEINLFLLKLYSNQLGIYIYPTRSNNQNYLLVARNLKLRYSSQLIS